MAKMGINATRRLINKSKMLFENLEIKSQGTSKSNFLNNYGERISKVATRWNDSMFGDGGGPRPDDYANIGIEDILDTDGEAELERILIPYDTQVKSFINNNIGNNIEKESIIRIGMNIFNTHGTEPHMVVDALERVLNWLDNFTNDSGPSSSDYEPTHDMDFPLSNYIEETRNLINKGKKLFGSTKNPKAKKLKEYYTAPSVSIKEGIPGMAAPFMSKGSYGNSSEKINPLSKKIDSLEQLIWNSNNDLAKDEWDEISSKLLSGDGSGEPREYWNEDDQKWREGEQFKIKATVKKHQISKFNKQKETIITRVKKVG